MLRPPHRRRKCIILPFRHDQTGYRSHPTSYPLFIRGFVRRVERLECESKNTPLMPGLRPRVAISRTAPTHLHSVIFKRKDKYTTVFLSHSRKMLKNFNRSPHTPACRFFFSYYFTESLQLINSCPEGNKRLQLRWSHFHKQIVINPLPNMHVPSRKCHLSERSVMNRNTWKTNYNSINLENISFFCGRNWVSVTTCSSFNNMLKTSFHATDGDWPELLRYSSSIPVPFLNFSFFA
jgi:hypothetical protein